jgi:hypothetical protein
MFNVFVSFAWNYSSEYEWCDRREQAFFASNSCEVSRLPISALTTKIDFAEIHCLLLKDGAEHGGAEN